MKKIVTLLTDFGTKDGYVGSVKGTIKNYFPDADIVDISHELDPFDIKSAAFTLNTYYDTFPKGTIHIVIVDPGVGSERSPLLIRTAKHFFLGPDNGAFKFVFNREACTSFELNKEGINPENRSHTFDGRDLFAPAAGKIMQGFTCEQLGKRLENRTEIANMYYSKVSHDTLQLEVINIDRYGNIITGFSKKDLERLNKFAIDEIKVKDFSTNTINNYYAEKEEGSLMALWNSMDFLEVAARNASAQKKLNFNKNKDYITIKIR